MNFPSIQDSLVRSEAEWLDDQITLIRNSAVAHTPKPAYEEFVQRSSVRGWFELFTCIRDKDTPKQRSIEQRFCSITLSYVYPLATVKKAYEHDLPLENFRAKACVNAITRLIDQLVIGTATSEHGSLLYLAGLGFRTDEKKPWLETACDKLRASERARWSPNEVEVILPIAFEQLPPRWERIKGEDADGGPPYGLVTMCHARFGGLAIYNSSAWR